MPDLDSILFAWTFVYAAALIGASLAQAARHWMQRSALDPSSSEALWCAALPPLAVVVCSGALWAIAALHPGVDSYFARLHSGWHDWERAVHSTPVLHGSLHVANILLLTFAIVCGLRTIYVFGRLHAFAADVRRFASNDGRSIDGHPIYRLASTRPDCFTMGILQPAVFISDRLLDSISDREYDAILAHEAAHIRRRDRLVDTGLTIFCHLFPLPGVRSLHRDWQRAAERACDAEAARRVGSPCNVAAALVTAARLSMRSTPLTSGLTGFACSSSENIEGRVQALLALQSPAVAARGRSRSLGTAIALSLTSLISASLWLQHAVEFLVRH